MLRLVLVILMLASFSWGQVVRGAANSEPIDVAVTCMPSSQKLVYRCDVRVTHAKTGFPLCINGGSIELDMPSMPMAHQSPKIDLHTDANGEMKDVEVRLQMLGEWRVLFRAGALTAPKSLGFQGGAAPTP